MRILHAEAGEDDGAFVGFAVAVGVFEEGDVVAVLDVAAVFVRQHAERDGEAFGEDARLAASSRSAIRDRDRRRAPCPSPCSRRAHRRRRGFRCRPRDTPARSWSTARRADRRRSARTCRCPSRIFRGDEFDLKALGQLEERALFLRRFRAGGDARCSDLSLRLGRRRRGLSFPRRRACRPSPTSAHSASAAVPRS